MNVLGISAFFHDAAACLIRDGEIIAAASEERFSRIKHDPAFPRRAIDYCLSEGKLLVDDLDCIGFYEKPLIKFKRILFSQVGTFPRSYRSFLTAIPSWLQQKLTIPQGIQEELQYDGPIYMIEHHLSHAASAFLASPFQEAAVLTVDGVGEWSTATWGYAQGTSIDILREIRFPHSLGLLYSAFTSYLGFKVDSAEYKVMGLAPYGVPRYQDKVRQLIEVADDGSFQLDMSYFAYHYGLEMTSEKFHELFGGPPREPEGPLEQYHRDIAASVQAVTEDVMLLMARNLHRETGAANLCLAGGVALNCVANGRIAAEGPYQELFVQPASGDAGGALGVAAFVSHNLFDVPRRGAMKHAFLGPSYGTEEIRALLDTQGMVFEEFEDDDLVAATVRALAEQKVVGWFQGRMEFGPRALGARSILADPRRPENRDAVNLKIKFRESFRPFAPAVPAERAAEFFELEHPSPFMGLVSKVRNGEDRIPAVTHVDGSARLQTVERDTNPLFHALLEAWGQHTGIPVLINTSFNVRGEPIVCSPLQAVECFLSTQMDLLVIDRFVLRREDQVAAAPAGSVPDTVVLD